MELVRGPSAPDDPDVDHDPARHNCAIEAPELSVVAIVGPRRGRAQRLLDALGAQSAAASIEAVIVDLDPAAGPLRLPGKMDVRVLERPRSTGIGEARVAAVRESRGAIVASLEDHCYPDPGWAEALIEAYRGRSGVVGYAFENANPETYASRAAFLAEYAWWLAPARPGPAYLLPNVNVSYRRELLEGFGEALPRLLDADFGLQEALRRRGVPMAIEPRALARHETEESLAAAGRAAAHYGRLLAARRVRQERWGAFQRLLYTALTPAAAPTVRVARLVANVSRRPEWVLELFVCLPGILVVAVLAAIGEATGYLAGEGDSLAGYRHAELEAVRARAS